MPVTAFEKGLQGQKAAETFLRSKGYTILERNYRIRSGEIDIIAAQDTYVVFIEVKTRNSLTYGYPCEAVNHKKQQKIINTAHHYIATKICADGDFRFDVVEVLWQNGQTYVKHIMDAFS